MYEKYNMEERCRKILEDNGGVIADKARTILLEDPALKDLRTPLEFISKNWRNPLTPALMSLSCEAVGGQPEETHQAALAMNLMSLSFYIWDDIIDKAKTKLFRSTLFGKFGESTALIIGGLASAKAFSIVNEMNIDKEKHQTVTRLFWGLWVKMAQAETVSLRLRTQRNFSSRNKFWKIKKEVAADLETCVRIGVVIGNGSKSEVRHLERYGLCLGMILEIWKDFHISVNLTLELAEKIRSGALPYSLLWAMEHSRKVRKTIDVANRKTIEQGDIREIVEAILETRAFDNTTKNIRRYAEDAKEALGKMKKNKAIQPLQLFIEAQPRLFNESFSMLKGYDS